MALKVDVGLKGPVFSPTGPDVGDSIRDTITEIVLTGEREARLMAQPSPAGLFRSREYAAAHGYFQTGHYNRSINGRVTDSMHGMIADSNVVYGPRLEGVSSRNQSTRFKGYAIFRKTAQKLQGLAGGILKKHMDKLTARLN